MSAPVMRGSTETPQTASIVERNIRSLIERRAAEERSRPVQDRLADVITRFVGSMTFVLLHLVIFGVWIVVNLGWVGIKPFDPSFTVLAMVASVEAIFLSTFVLITQNRMAALADRRADLDLQISLLAEHEVTRLIRLTMDVAGRLGIETNEPELEELTRDVAPEQVMDQVERQERANGR
jgi:uncharacterized membrane protein